MALETHIHLNGKDYIVRSEGGRSTVWGLARRLKRDGRMSIFERRIEAERDTGLRVLRAARALPTFNAASRWS